MKLCGDVNNDFVGGIFDLLDDIKKHTNIKNIEDETIANDNGGFFEYVSVEWN